MKKGVKKFSIKKAQTPVRPVSMSKKRLVKGLGFLFFLAGAFLIINSLFTITGYLTADNISRNKGSILGLALEVIGIILMMIRVGGPEPKAHIPDLKDAKKS